MATIAVIAGTCVGIFASSAGTIVSLYFFDKRQNANKLSEEPPTIKPEQPTVVHTDQSSASPASPASAPSPAQPYQLTASAFAPAKAWRAMPGSSVSPFAGGPSNVLVPGPTMLAPDPWRVPVIYQDYSPQPPPMRLQPLQSPPIQLQPLPPLRQEPLPSMHNFNIVVHEQPPPQPETSQQSQSGSSEPRVGSLRERRRSWTYGSSIEQNKPAEVQNENEWIRVTRASNAVIAEAKKKRNDDDDDDDRSSVSSDSSRSSRRSSSSSSSSSGSDSSSSDDDDHHRHCHHHKKHHHKKSRSNKRSLAAYDLALPRPQRFVTNLAFPQMMTQLSPPPLLSPSTTVIMPTTDGMMTFPPAAGGQTFHSGNM